MARMKIPVSLIRIHEDPTHLSPWHTDDSRCRSSPSLSLAHLFRRARDRPIFTPSQREIAIAICRNDIRRYRGRPFSHSPLPPFSTFCHAQIGRRCVESQGVAVVKFRLLLFAWILVSPARHITLIRSCDPWNPDLFILSVDDVDIVRAFRYGSLSMRFDARWL